MQEIYYEFTIELSFIDDFCDKRSGTEGRPGATLRIYVMIRFAHTMSAVDGVTFVVAATIQTARKPREILVVASKGLAYFSSQSREYSLCH